MAPAAASPPIRERTARVAIVLAILALPAVWLPRVLGTRDVEPGTLAPVRAHLVVLTCARAASLDALAAPEDLRLALARPGPVYAPSPDASIAAVSLWTGRWPSCSGVLERDDRLAPEAWTLARAFARLGHPTAVLAQEPIASRHGIGGFALVREEPALGLDELAAEARALLAAAEGGRSLLWLHLAADQRGELLALLWPALEADGIAPDVLLVATALSSTERGLDGSLRVPCDLLFPGGLLEGRRGRGPFSLVDLAGLALEFLELPLPDPVRGDRAIQSRTQSVLNAVQGGPASEWVLVQDGPRELLRTASLRLANPDRARFDPDSIAVEAIAPDGTTREVAEAERAKALASYRGLRETLAREE